ncbi:MAG TPA: PQQ-binding-like beta-propeller repeat protein, partial [Planctomycetaceae bacterium]|nr:PQQ-binding-like beta-propeller repeat protein [Planctomycetaceae bacterium]
MWVGLLAVAGCGQADADRPQVPAGELAEGDDWPAFLGPRGTGVSGETGLADRWPAGGPPVVWEKTVGTGYSAPSVRGHRLVLHHRLRGEEIVECFDARNGQPLWKHAYPTEFEDPYGYNNGPRCTPLLTETSCYTYGAEGKLVCTDLATGRTLWTRDVLQDFNLRHPESGLPNWFFGIGCTPVLEGNLLIALVGGQPDSGVVAFDARTGKTVWEAVGRDTWDGATNDTGERFRWTAEEQVVSYSSPIVATIHGRRHLLCFVRQGLVSLDPQTGRVNFKYWFRSRTFESVNAARPVVIGEKIFLTAAYQAGSALLAVNP